MTKGTGKKKIDIKKIANDSARKVTFSKRRTGLFKKAQELERISGARVAILVFSPSGRLYSSGDLSLFDNNVFTSKSHLSTEIASNSYTKPSTLRLKNFNVEGCNEIFSPAGPFYSPGVISLVDDDLKNNGFTSESHLSTEIASNSYATSSTLHLSDEGSAEIFSLAGRLYSSGEFSIVNDDLKNNGFTSESYLSTEIASNSYATSSTLHLSDEGSAEFFSLAGGLHSSGEFSIVNDDLKNNGFTSESHLSPGISSNSYATSSALHLSDDASTEIFSLAGGLYSSGEFSIDNDDLKNNGFTSESYLSTEIASNSYATSSTLHLSDEASTEIFSLAGGLYSPGEFSIVNDDLKNNEFTSESHLSPGISSNSYAKPSTLHLKNFNVEGSTEIFSPVGGLYRSGEVCLVDDDLKNNGFCSKSHLSTEICLDSYSEPSALLLKNFNVEGSTDFFSPAGQFYSSGELPIVDDDLKNHGFCSNSDLCTDFGSNLDGNCSVDELMLLMKKLEEERDKLVLKMELEFIDESLMV